MDDCELQCGLLKMNAGPLQDQPVLLTWAVLSPYAGNFYAHLDYKLYFINSPGKVIYQIVLYLVSQLILSLVFDAK